MAEYGKPGGRWQYAANNKPQHVSAYHPTATDVILYALVSFITIALVVALGVLLVLPLI